ncbi:MAG: hypothetical protein GYA16_07260 [Spirochaetes bacterium]|nr:hypothetical protein [Spirochaetota bacterium]
MKLFKIKTSIDKFNLKNYFLYFSIIILIILLKNGFWPIPNLKMIYQISQSLLKVPFDNPLAHYLFWNYFQNLLFKLLGGKSYSLYVVYTFATSLAFIFVFVIWFINYHGKDVAIKNNKVLLIAIFPVSMIPFYWFGLDGMTLLLMLLMMILLEKRVFLIVLSLFLSWQHFEQGFVGFGALWGSLILVYIMTRDRDFLNYIINLTIVLGVLLLGKAVLAFYFKIADVGIQGDRFTWLKHHLELMINQFKVSWHYILWSLFGVGWFFLVSNLRKLLPLMISICFVFLMLVVMEDQTRVGVIVLFPALFYWFFMNKSFIKSITGNQLLYAIILYLLIPTTIVWGGYPFGSLIEFDKKVISEFITTVKISNFDYLMPFRRESKIQDMVIKNLEEYKTKIILSSNRIVVNKNNDLEIPIRIENTSKCIYPSKGDPSGRYAVFASYHILDKNHNMIIHGGLRTSFPHDIAPGVIIPIKMKILANAPAGEYILAIDLVHEGVTWFGDKDKNNILEVPLVVK